MAGTIGGIACDIVRLQKQIAQEVVAEFKPPGFDGHGAAKLGLGGNAIAVTAIEYGDSTSVGTWAVSVTALVGSLVTIVDDWGVSFPQCLVLGASELRRSAARNAAGTQTQRGELELRVRQAL